MDKIDQLKAELAELEPKVDMAWNSYKKAEKSLEPYKYTWKQLYDRMDAVRTTIATLEQTQPK